jgi:hypothetical protein
MAESYNRNVVMEAAKNIAEGIPPTNMQINETIQVAKRAIDERQRGTLDARTGIIAQDLKAVLSDTQRLLYEKNRDEKMQRFLLEAKLAAEEFARESTYIQRDLKEAGRELRPLQDEALEILQMIKSVAYEIMRSPSFRRALVGAIDLFEQVFWDQMREKGEKLKEGAKRDIERGDISMRGTREAAEKVGEQARQELRRGQLPTYEGEERKQELKRRFNQLLREIGENPEYKQAVSDLLNLAGKLRSRLEQAKKRLKGAAKQAENVHITNMWDEGTKIIEEFTGHNRVKHILDALNDLFEFIHEDQRAKAFFGDLKKYVLEGLENPEKLTQREAQEAYDRLYAEGRELFKSEELKKRANALGNEFRDMIKTARRDPTSERLLDHTRALMRDLTVDTATGKPSLWALRDNIERSGRSLLLPVLLRELDVVPVKGIRGSNKTYDYAIRNLAFSAYDLLPERARFYMDLDVDLDLTDLKRERWSGEPIGEAEADITGEIVLRLDGIKTHVRDVEFHYIRKTFPQMEDWGRMDVDTLGSGTRIEVRWRIVSPRGSAPTVLGYRVYCGIDSLDVTIKEAAKHELIDRMMSKLFAGTLKERTEREIERALAAFASRVSLVFNDVFAGRMPSILPSSMTAALPVLSL